MKKDRLFDVMTDIDGDLIDEYYRETAKPKRRTWVKAVSVAAACAVVLTGVVAGVVMSKKNPFSGDPGVLDGTTDASGDHDVLDRDFRILSVSATSSTGSFIRPDTHFKVECEGGSADLVRRHLYFTNAPEYTVTEVEKDVYDVELASSVPDNSVISASYVRDGIVSDSWAFQTEGKLSVSRTYPANGGESVPLNAVISVEFSFAGVSGVAENTVIEPSVAGEWTQNGRKWIFTPSDGLAADTDYTVTVASGIKTDNVVMEKAHVFRFTTKVITRDHNVVPSVVRFDGINSYVCGEQIVIKCTDYSDVSADYGEIKLRRFASADAILAYSDGDHSVKTEDAGTLGIEAAESRPIGQDRGESVLIFTDGRPDAGYYVAGVYSSDGGLLFDWLMQVSPLTASSVVTERDILVMAAENGSLAENVKISFDGKEYVTDVSGCALLDEVCDGSGTVKHILVGENTPLILEAHMTEYGTYPSVLMNSDKEQYKQTDTVNVWGFVPEALFYDGFDRADLMLTVDEDTAVPLSFGEDGTFLASYEMKDHAEGSLSLTLTYKGVYVGGRAPRVVNYESKLYEYENVSDSNFVYAGDDYEMAVKVTHISGMPAVGKYICASYGELGNVQEMTSVTDESGIAHFTVHTAEGAVHNGSVLSDAVLVKSGEASEYSSGRHDLTFYIIEAGKGVISDYRSSSRGFEVREIVTDGLSVVSDKKELYGDLCDAPVYVEVLLDHYSRTVTGTETSKSGLSVVKTYSDSVRDTIFLDEYETSTVGGKILFDNRELEEKYPLPESDGLNCYTLRLSVSFTVGEGKYDSHVITAASNFYDDSGAGHYFPGGYNARLWSDGTVVDTYESYIYDFTFTNEHQSKNNITLSVDQRSGDALTSDARIITAVCLHGIDSVGMYDADADITVTVPEEDFPDARIVGICFSDGVFTRIAPIDTHRDQSERNIVIGISADKDEYAPGDEVTLDIVCTDENGAPISASVNLNVCDKASLPYGYGDTLSYDPYYYFYTVQNNLPAVVSSSTYRRYDFDSYPGGLGGGDPRSYFKDTAYFGCVTTDENGHATVTFTLPDDVTTYVVSAIGVNSGLYTGFSQTAIRSRLDFFVQSVQPRNLKASDDVVLSACAMAETVRDCDITFEIKEIAKSVTVSSQTSKSVKADFGKLAVGTYTAVISAKSGTDEDAISFTFEVADSTQSRILTGTTDGNSVLEPEIDSLPVTLEITRKETARYLDYIDFMKSYTSERFDHLFGYYASVGLGNIINGTNWHLPEYITADYRSETTIDGSYYAALKRVPSGDEDIVLTALSRYFWRKLDVANELYTSIAPDDGSAPSSERELVEELLFRSVVRENVLDLLCYVKDNISDDPYDRAVLALSFAVIGDYADARDVYKSIGDESDIDGFDSIRCMVAVLIDRANAGAMIDKVIAENPGEMYLDFAVSLYVYTGIRDTSDASVTVKYGDTEKVVKIVGCGIGKVTVSDMTDRITFTSDSDDIVIRYSYRTDSKLTETDSLKYGVGASLSSAVASENEVVDLTVRCDSLPGGRVSAEIALPNGLRLGEIDRSRYDIIVSATEDRVYVYMDEDSDRAVTIPLTVILPGEYVIEPVIALCGDMTYFSDSLTVSANGDFVPVG